MASARQSESVYRQQSDLRKDDDRKLPIDSVEKKQKHPSGHKRGDPSTQRKSGPPKEAPQQSKCTHCGLSPSHDIKSCPATAVYAEGVYRKRGQWTILRSCDRRR